MASISQPLWPNVGAQQLAPFQTPKCRSKCRSRSYKSTVGGVLEDVFMVISVVGAKNKLLELRVQVARGSKFAAADAGEFFFGRRFDS